MTEQVFPNIYRLGVPLPENPLKELNSYVIKGKDRHLLIDTGFNRPECLDALKEGLRELDVSMDDTDIYLTHCHSDHAGLAPEVCAPSTRVRVSDIDRLRLEEKTRAILEDQITERYAQAGIPQEEMDEIDATHPGRKLAPRGDFDRYESVSDGDAIEAGDYRFEVIMVPGHTPGNTCLWDKEKKLMMTGDHVLFDITPNITFWSAVKDSLGDYLDSLRKVLAYPVETALPGHRKTGAFHPRVEALIAHHEFRLNECWKVVQEEPHLAPYDIAGRMTWRVRAKDWSAFPVAQRWFAVGECMSHLDYLRLRDRVKVDYDDNGTERYVACL